MVSKEILMNQSTFMYGIACGCGSTKVTLEFGEETESPKDIPSCQQLENIFGKKPLSVQIDYNYNWMCKDRLKKIYSGFYYEDTENHGFICVIDTLENIKGHVWYECFIAEAHRTPQTMEISDIYSSTTSVWTTDKADKKSIVMIWSSGKSSGMYVPYNEDTYNDSESKLKPKSLCLRYTQQEPATPAHKKIKK